ncbi:MAG: hypothetical protein WCD18_24655 [Thermosynechococcaceae cyanobacterium]
MNLKRVRSIFPLFLGLLVTSGCQSNNGISATQDSLNRQAEIHSDSIPSNLSQTKNSVGSSCTINSSPQLVAFLPLPESLSVTQMQKSHPVGSNFGIGFLIELQGDHSDPNLPEWNPGYDWLGRLHLPLYDVPNGKAWGWLACGWLVDLSSSAPKISWLEPSLLQTAYETYSFIVLKEKPDGWFQLRYSVPTSRHQGVAWAHRSHLKLGDRPLIIQYWKNIFQPSDLKQTSNRGWLHFRNDASSTYLRLRHEPTATSKVIFPNDEIFLQKDYGIEPIKIQGNWMRVRISFPQDYCVGSSRPTEFNEGWIQWWIPEQGTLLYYSARGC